ncbi:hypothetical protein SERLA73DRAFT_127269 [Serpula lacrymans var. lacrymans S7.3]|uniref:Dihydroorotate oxidase n=2 Tax=Serpula lacrymans var. lacrymans TaxID=341189 RepID=F8QG62_SERL3|nr:uncharacterized protein SERLADRAFT_374190 [Serpula lacrymans var. lacrymans S7.9]EGN92677.1 hypothetical protein SERLA73DRAFT_127269 [Serpula lacrymans var. lacrymans S7.3]EGO19458.1 hypothetical protein SERLADRAFT_374190 [Serpula lacrymans var. lacrymans S7.9]
MVQLRHLDVSPPLINSSCAWASDLDQLLGLFQSPYTGAVTTRTATLHGFAEDSSHTVAFLKDSLSSLNSYGYSPYPLATYLGWVESIISQDKSSHKPFIISITSYSPADFSSMLDAIQRLRTKSPLMRSRIGVELNTSCPNIKGSPPPSYQFSSLVPLLDVLARHFWEDQTLTIGLKLPPYVASSQFVEVVQGISGFTRTDEETGKAQNPFAFFTCTNTLGCSLAFAEQSREIVDYESQFAVPPGLGGLAGEAIHSLSLGNVFSFSRLLAESPDAAMRDIVIIGVGGVTSPEAAERMRRAGAKIVGCATLLGQQGVVAFEHLTEKS